jgi:hypothetical protein
MADKSVPQNTGGQYLTAFTGGNVETLIYTGSGRLCKLAITTAGTASVSVYDGTNSTTGTLIFTSLTNDALGTVKDLQMPITTGIVLKGTTGAPAFAVCYNKDGALGL